MGDWSFYLGRFYPYSRYTPACDLPDDGFFPLSTVVRKRRVASNRFLIHICVAVYLISHRSSAQPEVRLRIGRRYPVDFFSPVRFFDCLDVC